MLLMLATIAIEAGAFWVLALVGLARRRA